MTRREIREQIFQMLFRVEFVDEENLREQMNCYLEKFTGTEEDRAYFISKMNGLIEHISEFDAKLNEVSEGWPTNRMGKVELTILRLGMYEMKYEENIPESVAINEAVELAKKFGSNDAPAFVNAILAKLV